MSPAIPVIDIHAHHFPLGLPDLGSRTGEHRWPTLVVSADRRSADIRRGTELFRRVSPSCFDASARIAEMDRAGVHRQVISPVPVMLTDWAPVGPASLFCRTVNDALAEVAASSGGRLLAFGAVPLPHIKQALTELERLRDELGLVGVELSAFPGGLEFDDPTLEPFWAVCAAQQVPVLVHPAHQELSIRRRGQPYEFGIGMHTDTALAAAALVFGGVLDRHPELRIALSHGCGAFPWTYPRLRYQATMTEPSRSAALDDAVRRLWADILVFDPLHLEVLVARFGADHLLYGTDHPFYPDGLQGPIDVLNAARRAGIGVDERALGLNAVQFLGLG